ncbi:MAG TPA: Vms1/Ankzf1 family peptidyl-tRNA hydrolase [Actinomycetaceae bacterium]|nr:Vms1/Ankzf1 family peptidyl-tRNA hydrolase [Actinomycetaceae bacterium]
MQIDWLTDQIPSDQPVITVVIDATRESEQGSQTVQTRWRDLQRGLSADGDIPPSLLDLLDEAMRVPTHVSGEHGRVLVATPDEIVIDRVLAAPPQSDMATRGICAATLARIGDETVRYLVAEIDRSGADLTLQENVAMDFVPSNGNTTTVEGSHDVLHKVRRAGLATRRLQSRAEDSWERNAELVAEELDSVVARRRPELLILTGDVRAVSLVRGRLGKEAQSIATVVEGGSRAEGVNAEAFEKKIAHALETFRHQRREQVADQFRQEEGRDGTACRGLDDVMAALQRGQVAELLLTEEAASLPSELARHQVWVGDSAMQLARSRQDLADAGDDEPRELTADLALGAAGAQQRAGYTIVDPAQISLPDGVGALLRWRDDSTPGQNVYSLSGDTGRT